MQAFRRSIVVVILALSIASCLGAAESPYLYGIHDTSPAPTEYLSHIKQGSVTGGWITSTVAVGYNPSDYGGVDFTGFANQGHTVVCRINNGYSDVGTIPLPQHYAAFAQRCANFVQNSPGCEIWIIGNETNLACEWPPDGSHKPYVSPQSYAECFRLAYNAIKAVRPHHKVICQPLAPFGGPYGAGTFDRWTHDACPLSWVDYTREMLTAIKSTGGLDGIALHINSRGYTYNDIHSTAQVNAGGKNLYFSFYVYKDWINYGIPSDLYHLPLYATECNGIYYWKGGHPERPTSHYEPGWMQEIYAEINRWNQTAVATGKPVFRCINMYRWCNGCDGWNIDGSSNPYKAQILSDLDAAVAQAYRWPEPPQFPGNITGFVRDRNGSTVGGVTVSTATGGYTTVTASNGSYTLAGVEPGAYTMTASKIAFCYQTVSGVTVTSNGTTTQDFSLTRIGDNLLTNGNFEGGFQGNGVANGWKAWTSGWSNQLTFADSTSPVRSGLHAQKWGRADRLRLHGGICQAAGGVTPGRQYTVGGWIRFEATDPGAWVEIGYDLTGQTSNGEAASVVYTKLESGGQNVWLNYSRTVTATGNAVSVFLKFGQYNEGGSGPSWAYADDVSISEVPTPPIMVHVTDDGAWQTNLSSIHGTWLASDPESGVIQYMWAVSATPDESSIVSGGGWTSVGTATQGTRSVTLQKGAVYYILAKARNPHNQWSTVMASDGIRIVEGPYSLPFVKRYCSDGKWVEAPNLVCTHAPVSGIMPVREEGNMIGIKVTEGSGSFPPGIVPGTRLTVAGRLVTVADTREITDAAVTMTGSGDPPAVPLLIGRDVGGADFFYSSDPVVLGQKGTSWGIGPNNVGLLVTVIGKVITHAPGKFFLDDGSAITGGLPVTCLPGITRPDLNRTVKVTGLVEANGLLVLSQGDIAVFPLQ